MGISTALSNAYAKLEDAYYGVLDFFEEKGIGVPWAYNDFLENKGIPALPFTIALLVLVIAGMSFVWTSSQPIDKTLSFNLKDGKGLPLYDVGIKIYDQDGVLLKDALVSDGTTLTLKGLKPGTKLSIKASKDGYASGEFDLSASDNDVQLSLQGDNDAITGKIKLVDKESQTTIFDATLTIEWAGNDIPRVVSPDEEGIATFSDLPRGVELTLSVRADDYEDLQESITFTNEDVKIKQLTPKASATTGNSTLIVKAIDAQTKNLIENVHVKIEDARTGDIISDLDVPSGTHSETLSKGTIIRVTVTKEDYISYTSNTQFPEGKILRKEEEQINAEMQFGGTNLTVIVQAGTGGMPLDSVKLDLLDAQNEKIQSLTSNFSGETEFIGLNETENYSILAFHPNYFPARKNVEWETLPSSDTGKTLIFSLTPISSGNAATVTVFVSESDGKAAIGSTVSLDELVEDIPLPLVREQSTDIAGSFTLKLPIGMKTIVKADKGNLHAEEEVEIKSGLNRVLLSLSGTQLGFELRLRYANGDAFIGTALVESLSGIELFNGAVTDGMVEFDPLTNTTVNLTATLPNGNPVKKTLNIEGKNSLEVILNEDIADTDAPKITFVGLFDADGNPIPGLTPTTDAFARFAVVWPSTENQSGGILVRVGTDSILTSDSQFLGIYGLNAQTSKTHYGKTWNPLPSPGNEFKDRQSSGKAGSYNKWMEALVESPRGTQTFDVRLKARIGIPLGTQELHYRAFVQRNGDTIRTPLDAQLETKPYTSQKSGLYAQTTDTAIAVYSTLPICQGNICARVSFIDSDAREYPTGNFTAMRERAYALQVEIIPAVRNNPATIPLASGATENPNLVPLSSIIPANPNIPTLNLGTTANPSVNVAGAAVLRASTDALNTNLVFTKGELNNFGPLAKEGLQETSISIPLTGYSAATALKARVHFVPQKNGQGTIQLQINASGDSWQETLPISIVDARTLSVEYSQSVEVGESISFIVKDESSQLITNALISLNDAQGKLAASMQGKNLPNAGENGNYVLAKALPQGVYALKVSSPGFIPFEDALSVGLKSAIQLDEKIEINIPAGQKTITKNVNVKNNSNFPLSNITAEIDELGKFPPKLSVQIQPISTIPPKGSAPFSITATYTGQENDTDTISGTATLKVRAEANSKFPLYASAQLLVSYNKQLDSSCLQFDKQKVIITLLDDEQPYPTSNYYTNGTNNNDLTNYGETDYSNSSYYGNRYQTQTPAYNAQGYNQYGYDNTGAYRNPTNKRASVKVKNNCGVELNLITSVNAATGNQEVDGLKIAAVDSSLLLPNGQERQVDFTINQPYYRAGSYLGGAPLVYGLNFRAPQVFGSVPLEINFWNKSNALLTPQAVTLNLVKTGNQKAVDRVPVPIQNNGLGPIYNLTFQIVEGYNENPLYGGFSAGENDSSTAQLNTETTPSILSFQSNGGTGYYGGTGYPAAGNNSNYRSQTQPTLEGVTVRVESNISSKQLAPGQSILPPIVLVGESTSDKVQQGIKSLIVSGQVDGRRTVLKNIPIYIQVGKSSCIKVTAAATPITFVSTQTTGTQAQRLTIRNECLEPLRIGQISPSTAGANTLALTPIDGDNTIEKDAEKTFQLGLTKTIPYKGNLSVEVQGLLQLSQKIVKSEPIPIEMRIGPDELSSEHASGQVQVPVCENPQEKINVRFPILANRDECSQAYCDSEQLANMLSRQMEQQMSKAVQLIQSKKSDAAQIPGCDLTKRYCTFSQMGISSPSIDVYLQHDAFTPQLLSYVMRGEKYPRLGNMQAELLPTLSGENPAEALESKFGTGFANRVFIPEIQGCGVYTLSITGGIEMAGNQLQPEQINMGILLLSPRKDTGECQYKIQNVANFLPKDRSLQLYTNNQQTQLGVIESAPELRAQGEKLAETIFGSKTRYATNTSTNRLSLNVSNQEESIVELTLDPATAGNETKHIIGNVRRTQGTVQDQVIVEVGKIITQLGKNVNGCITRDERTWKIYSGKDIGTFQFQGCALTNTKEGGLTVRGTQTCCMLETKSEIKSDVGFSLTPNGQNPTQGLKQLDLFEIDPTDAKQQTRGSVVNYGGAYPLQFNSQNQKYQKNVLLCGLADAQTQNQANKGIIEVSATRLSDDKKAGPLKLELRVCTQRPADALAGAIKKGDGTYYATADLDDNEKQSQTIAQVINEISAGKKLPAGYFAAQGNGVPSNANPVYQDAFKTKQAKALGWGMGACMGTCMGCRGVTGIGGGFAGVGKQLAGSFVPCAMSCGFGTVVAYASVYKDDLAQVPVLGSVLGFIGTTMGGLTDALADVFGVAPENRPAFDAAVTGGAIGTLSGGKGWSRLYGVGIGAASTAAFAIILEAVISEDAQRQTVNYDNRLANGIEENKNNAATWLREQGEKAKEAAQSAAAATQSAVQSIPNPFESTTPETAAPSTTPPAPTTNPSTSPATGKVTQAAFEESDSFVSPATGLAAGDAPFGVGVFDAGTPADAPFGEGIELSIKDYVSPEEVIRSHREALEALGAGMDTPENAQRIIESVGQYAEKLNELGNQYLRISEVANATGDNRVANKMRGDIETIYGQAARIKALLEVSGAEINPTELTSALGGAELTRKQALLRLNAAIAPLSSNLEVIEAMRSGLGAEGVGVPIGTKPLIPEFDPVRPMEEIRTGLSSASESVRTAARGDFAGAVGWIEVDGELSSNAINDFLDNPSDARLGTAALAELDIARDAFNEAAGMAERAQKFDNGSVKGENYIAPDKVSALREAAARINEFSESLRGTSSTPLTGTDPAPYKTAMREVRGAANRAFVAQATIFEGLSLATTSLSAAGARPLLEEFRGSTVVYSGAAGLPPLGMNQEQAAARIRIATDLENATSLKANFDKAVVEVGKEVTRLKQQSENRAELKAALKQQRDLAKLGKETMQDMVTNTQERLIAFDEMVEKQQLYDAYDAATDPAEKVRLKTELDSAKKKFGSLDREFRLWKPIRQGSKYVGAKVAKGVFITFPVWGATKIFVDLPYAGYKAIAETRVGKIIGGTAQVIKVGAVGVFTGVVVGGTAVGRAGKFVVNIPSKIKKGFGGGLIAQRESTITLILTGQASEPAVVNAATQNASGDAAIKMITQEITAREEGIAELTKQLKESKKEVKELNKRFKAEKDSLKKAPIFAELETAKAKVVEAEKGIASFRAQQPDAVTRLAKATELKAAQDVDATAKNKIATLQSEVGVLTGEVSDFENRRNASPDASERTNLDKQIASKRAEILSREKVISREKLLVGTREARVNTAQIAYDGSAATPSPVAVQEATGAVVALQKQIDEIKTEIAKNKSELKPLQTQPTNGLGEAERTKIAVLETRVEAANQRVTDMQTQLNAHQQTIARAQAAAAGDPAEEAKKVGSTLDPKAKLDKLKTDAQIAKNNVDIAEAYVKEIESQIVEKPTAEQTAALKGAESKLLEEQGKARELNRQVEEADATAKAQEKAKAEAKGKKKDKTEGENKGKFSFKEFARGFVCDVAGGIAGYKVYASNLKDEIEGKVTIEAGSNNVLNPETGEIEFRDGDTYKYTVTPDAQTPGGKKVVIDIISPQEKVPIGAWVEDCGQQTTSANAPTRTAPTATNPTADANAFQRELEESARAGIEAGRQAEAAAAAGTP